MSQRMIGRHALGALTKLGQGGQGVVYRAPNASTKFAESMVYKEYKQDARDLVRFATLTTMPTLVDNILSEHDRMELVALAAWPCALVENSNVPVGFVMPAIPKAFYIDLTTVKGVSRTAAEFQHLLNPHSVLAARNIVVTDRQRYQLLRAVAKGLSFLHRIGVCVGDISPKNLLFSLKPLPAVYFIDCDAMRINGASALPQVETPEWEVPAGEELATVQSDTYKLGLLALRLLTGDQHTKDTQQLPPTTPKLVRQLINDTLVTDPSRRPLPATWVYLLRDALGDTKGDSGARPTPSAPNRQQQKHAPEPPPVVRNRPTAVPTKQPTAASAPTLVTTASAPSATAWYPTNATRAVVAIALFVVALIVVVVLIVVGMSPSNGSSKSNRHAGSSPSNITTTAPPSAETTTTSPPSTLSSTSQAIIRASAGSCIRRIQGAQRSDGSSYQVTVSNTECSSPDATDTVDSIQYTSGTPTCTYWVRTSEVTPPKVLCLSTLSGRNGGANATAAGPPATIPGPADAGYCGAHTSPWNCWSDVSPARPGEVAFINDRLQYQMAGIPTDRTRLLQIGRGVCQSLAGGTHPNYIVKWLAEDIGVTEDQAGQLFIMAKDKACS